MKACELIDVIQSKGFNVRYSWSKDYGNGTSLYECKVYKTSRHRKPLAFVQIGYYNGTKTIIGATFCHADNPMRVVDIEGGEDMKKVLNKCLESLHN